MHQHAGLRGGQPARDLAGAQHGGQRQVAAGERLADAHHVRRHAGGLGGEERAGPAEAGGDLVEDQHQPVLVGDLAHHPQARGVVDVHAAGALQQRLDDDPGELVGVRRGERAERRRPSRRRRRRARAAGRRRPAAAARPRTSSASRRPGRTRSCSRRCRRGSRRARSASGSARAGRRRAGAAAPSSAPPRRSPSRSRRGRRARAPRAPATTSRSASRTAGAWVSPPNITCAIRPSLVGVAAASSSGTAYPWIAAHHDDIPSTSSVPSAEPQPDAGRALDQPHRRRVGHRRVGVPDVLAVVREQLVAARASGVGRRRPSRRRGGAWRGRASPRSEPSVLGRRRAPRSRGRGSARGRPRRPGPRR